MTEVFKICITKISDEEMISVNSVEAIAGKGLIKDRYFKENNNKLKQITLIESEVIDSYNEISGTNLDYLKFRRNIITKGIKLNDLVGYKILLGEVVLKVHQLCEPCRELQEKLNEDNLVKKMVHKGGLRCEILKSGTININDLISILD